MKERLKPPLGRFSFLGPDPAGTSFDINHLPTLNCNTILKHQMQMICCWNIIFK